MVDLLGHEAEKDVEHVQRETLGDEFEGGQMALCLRWVDLPASGTQNCQPIT